MCKKFTLIIVLLTLTSCAVGPTLFTIGGYNITLGSVVSIPIKKKVAEELNKEERNFDEENTRKDSEET
ncbi:uncharacterized protein METZ01_LOCUS336927 [marine metagenome]|uniref:Lipoprotein n=1 Tax=marine metagenome TaxID=408172 RepID=A0A382QEV5_9ZZZZ